jgi:hypothetical protein
LSWAGDSCPLTNPDSLCAIQSHGALASPSARKGAESVAFLLFRAGMEAYVWGSAALNNQFNSAVPCPKGEEV